MREIKFRFFVPSKSKMIFPENESTNMTGDDLVEEADWKVMQYTGLKDKNGVEIYEGDIVRAGWYDEENSIWQDDEVHKIEYCGESGYPAFELEPHPGHDMNGLAYIFQTGEHSIEIIGNIHEQEPKT